MESTSWAVSQSSAKSAEGSLTHWKSFTWAHALHRSCISARAIEAMEDLQEPKHPKSPAEQGWGSILSDPLSAFLVLWSNQRLLRGHVCLQVGTTAQTPHSSTKGVGPINCAQTPPCLKNKQANKKTQRCCRKRENHKTGQKVPQEPIGAAFGAVLTPFLGGWGRSGNKLRVDALLWGVQ